MSGPLKLGIQRQTFSMTYSKMMSYFNKEIHGRIKSFSYFRNGVQMMFGFVGKECSPIFAQRVTRTYRTFQLHSKLWSNFTKMHNYPGPRKLILGFVVTSLCQPQFDLIRYDDLINHKNDLDYIHELTEATVVCPRCKDRLIISKKLPNIKYCHCPNSEPVYNKKTSGFPWTPFVETADLIIWRQPHPKFDGLYTYKVYGYYDDISPLDFLATQLDLDYRKKWDNLVVQLKVVDQDTDSSTEVVHWEMKWPKMFSNRDYCFVRRHVLEKRENTIVIMSKAVKHPGCPEVKGVVRVNDYWSTMHIKPVRGLKDNGVEFGLTYFDNPGLSLPQWLTNWAAMAGIPDFLNKVRLAARAKRENLPAVDDKENVPVVKPQKNRREHPHQSPRNPNKKLRNISNTTICSDIREVTGGTHGHETGSVVELVNPVNLSIAGKVRGGEPVPVTSHSRNSNGSDDSLNSGGTTRNSLQAKPTSNASTTSTLAAVTESTDAQLSSTGSSSSSSSANGSLTGPASGNSSTESGEILSQFFKQNFLTAPSS